MRPVRRRPSLEQSSTCFVCVHALRAELFSSPAQAHYPLALFWQSRKAMRILYKPRLLACHFIVCWFAFSLCLHSAVQFKRFATRVEPIRVEEEIKDLVASNIRDPKIYVLLVPQATMSGKYSYEYMQLSGECFTCATNYKMATRFLLLVTG